MSLNSYDIDAAAFADKVMMVVSVDPLADFETGVIKTNDKGETQWQVEVLIREPGRLKSVTEHVKVWAVEAPTPSAPTDVPLFNGLIGRPWSTERNHGLALAAESVVFKPRAVSTNGHTDRDHVSA